MNNLNCQISRPVYYTTASLLPFTCLVSSRYKQRTKEFYWQEWNHWFDPSGIRVDQIQGSQLPGSWGFLSGINLQEKWSSRYPVFPADGMRHQGKSRPLCYYLAVLTALRLLTYELLFLSFNCAIVVAKTWRIVPI